MAFSWRRILDVVHRDRGNLAADEIRPQPALHAARLPADARIRGSTAAYLLGRSLAHLITNRRPDRGRITNDRTTHDGFRCCSGNKRECKNGGAERIHSARSIGNDASQIDLVSVHAMLSSFGHEVGHIVLGDCHRVILLRPGWRSPVQSAPSLVNSRCCSGDRGSY